jgi:hypothetical protein
MTSTLQIKLLHERLGHAKHRKVEGRSGKKYLFHWNDPARAYCFQPADQAEADDLFNGQGRGTGAYFAPLIPVAPVAPAKNTEGGEVPPDVLLELVRFEIKLPTDRTDVALARALLAAHTKGAARSGHAHTPPSQLAEPVKPVPATAAAVEVVNVLAQTPPQPSRKGKSPPPAPAPK